MSDDMKSNDEQNINIETELLGDNNSDLTPNEEIETDFSIGDPLDILQKEVDEWKDKYMRAYADFENTKKRLEKDKALAVAYSNESFAKDMLGVMDSFDAAILSIENTEDESSELMIKIKDGVQKTHEQLKKMLEKHGICEIDCESGFDPLVHQAIMQIESKDHKDGEIVQVLQKGYNIKNNVLRPAMVSTAK
jgi:molecular chaperone GrpE